MQKPNGRANALFGAVLRPFQIFFALEAASGLLLLAAAVVAFAWANSPLAESYHAVFRYPFRLGFGGHDYAFTLEKLINDGLMAIFFFVVGLEIKRELVVGELRTVQQAMLPLIGAAGGMVLPAAIYLLFNAGKPSSVGWGIPMATDIAFSLACLAALKGRVPNGLVVFLTALAIFDDLGGILVIAIFYGSGLNVAWLLVALGVALALYGCNRLYVRNGVVYAVLGAALWFALHAGGIHATIAGVILGLSIPARPDRPGREILSELRDAVSNWLQQPPDEALSDQELLTIEEKLEDLEPPLNRFVHLWHPYVAYGIIPLFALANSGVSLSGVSLADLANPVPLGIGLGLFVGKQLGISLFTIGAVRLGLAPSPGNARAVQVYGVSIIAGIGFTVALFVAGLAFPGAARSLDEAKLGILVGSLVSAVTGMLVLRLTSPLERAEAPEAGVA